ncbi:hypothetical protein CDL12_24311 [Handroanthus impetiginosus]|uniref:HAT C-terminal dimerisation domain-containing protein n=1 Tax=Handroanthus impetiginosus TaxID=429701 RepID=A0A2G9GD88_9LAMI|nr:hypothetical protein CDL12_24311 [Handroanthus impetiginosus]
MAIKREFSKILRIKVNQSAFYVHCFAHQLQLALVAVAKKQVEIASLFNLVATLINVVGISCKRRDILREKHANVIREILESGEISSGRGDTRWGSHYSTLLKLVSMFSSIVEVLEIIEEDGMNSEQRAEAYSLLCSMQFFEFIFNLYLMRKVLGINHEPQLLRDNEWDTLLEEVLRFCEKHKVTIPNMDENFIAPGQIKTKLLICVACLSPRDSFSSFEKKNLVQLAKLYSRDFSSIELLALDAHFENYISDMRSNSYFDELTTICELSKKLVKTRKHIVYLLVYILVKLALILPVATTTVERIFFVMNIIKNKLRNSMGDE